VHAPPGCCNAQTNTVPFTLDTYHRRRQIVQIQLVVAVMARNSDVDADAADAADAATEGAIVDRT
jgi:hypothetical protein